MTPTSLDTPRPPSKTQLGRKFNLLWSASGISAVGDGMRDAALPLLAATLSDSPSAVALVKGAAALPWLIMSLHAGVIADRSDRRRLMWTIDFGRGAIVLGFAAWALLSSPPLAALAVLAFALGCGETIFSNAATSALPDVVRADQLDAANGRMQGSVILGANLGGPLLGTALFALAAWAPFTVDGTSFLVAAVLVTFTGQSGKVAPRADRRPMATEIREGVRWLLASPEVRLLTVVSTLGAMAFFMANTMMVLLVTRTLDAPVTAFGVVLAAAAVGGTAASMLAGRISRRIDRSARIALGFGLMGSCWVLLGLSSSWLLVAAISTGTGFGVVLWNVQATSLRQQAVPKELLGRVNSCYMLISRLGIIVGTALSGWIAGVTSIRVPIVLGGAVLLLCLLLVPRLARIEAAPAAVPGQGGPAPAERTGSTD
ncbi:MFS transporter [Streptomyces rubellomurinus]|uniref:MFS transporter n=1 Tax=Streptomyces sp. Y1 TaxID=3238634 RepID=A0AB39TS98_9ACTN|nr:MFS transporter [Streptomyces rubellomurinus]